VAGYRAVGLYTNTPHWNSRGQAVLGTYDDGAWRRSETISVQLAVVTPGNSCGRVNCHEVRVHRWNDFFSQKIPFAVRLSPVETSLRTVGGRRKHL
jgi:hypothetical protein